jgi:hypothetical protein
MNKEETEDSFAKDLPFKCKRKLFFLADEKQIGFFSAMLSQQHFFS